MIRRDTKAVMALLALLSVVGCDAGGNQGLPGEEILAVFEAGATRDDVVEALPDGELSSSPQVSENQIDHGYVTDDYLIDGQRIVVLWVHDAGEGLPEGGDPRTAVLPVVFVNDVLDGFGWDHYDGRVVDWSLPDRWTGSSVAPGGEAQEPGPEVRSF